jgi:hypothetical protein
VASSRSRGRLAASASWYSSPEFDGEQMSKRATYMPSVAGSISAIGCVGSIFIVSLTQRSIDQADPQTLQFLATGVIREPLPCISGDQSVPEQHVPSQPGGYGEVGLTPWFQEVSKGLITLPAHDSSDPPARSSPPNDG